MADLGLWFYLVMGLVLVGMFVYQNLSAVQ